MRSMFSIIHFMNKLTFTDQLFEVDTQFRIFWNKKCETNIFNHFHICFLFKLFENSKNLTLVFYKITRNIDITFTLGSLRIYLK